jgi:hypothetical protein
LEFEVVEVAEVLVVNGEDEGREEEEEGRGEDDMDVIKEMEIFF